MSRTPEQYAIEHGRHLATAAKRLLDAFNAEYLAEEALNEDWDNRKDLADALQDAQESRSDAWKALESAIYEFTKRADRAYPLPQQPAAKGEG